MPRQESTRLAVHLALGRRRSDGPYSPARLSLGLAPVPFDFLPTFQNKKDVNRGEGYTITYLSSDAHKILQMRPKNGQLHTRGFLKICYIRAHTFHRSKNLYPYLSSTSSFHCIIIASLQHPTFNPSTAIISALPASSILSSQSILHHSPIYSR